MTRRSGSEPPQERHSNNFENLTGGLWKLCIINQRAEFDSSVASQPAREKVFVSRSPATAPIITEKLCQMSRTDKAARGFVTAILQYIATILVQVLLAPVILRMAGRETLGAFSAIMQVLGFIALTDFMGAWVMERYLAQATGLDDGGERFRQVFTTVKTMIILCASAYAVLVAVFSFFVARLFHLSPHIGHQAQYAFWVIAVWVILRSPFAAYQNASVATQDIAAANLIATFIQIGRTVGSLIIVLLGGGLFGLVVIGSIIEGVGYVFYRWRFRRMSPHLMPGWGIPDKRLLREMAGFGAHASLLNLGNALLYNCGNVIAGFTKGAAMASSFYTTQMPTMTGYYMTMRLSDSSMPAINELWGRQDKDRLRSALRRLTRLLLAMTLPLAAGALLFNRDLVIVWVGARQYAGTLLTASLAAFCIIASLQRVAVVYSYTFGWMRVLTTTGLLQGIANFGLAFFLAERFGLGGIMLALVLVIVPQTVVLWQRISRFLEINVPSLLGGCVVRSVIPLSAAGVAGLLVHRVVHISKHDFMALAAETGAFLVAYVALAYPLVLFREDRHQIRAFLASLSGRLRRIPEAAPASR